MSLLRNGLAGMIYVQLMLNYTESTCFYHRYKFYMMFNRTVYFDILLYSAVWFKAYTQRLGEIRLISIPQSLILKTAMSQFVFVQFLFLAHKIWDFSHTFIPCKGIIIQLGAHTKGVRHVLMVEH